MRVSSGISSKDIILSDFPTFKISQFITLQKVPLAYHFCTYLAFVSTNLNLNLVHLVSVYKKRYETISSLFFQIAQNLTLIS